MFDRTYLQYSGGDLTSCGQDLEPVESMTSRTDIWTGPIWTDCTCEQNHPICITGFISHRIYTLFCIHIIQDCFKFGKKIDFRPPFFEMFGENVEFRPPFFIIVYMRPASERRRYIVTSSLIGWVHKHNDPCVAMLVTKGRAARGTLISRCLNTVKPIAQQTCLQRYCELQCKLWCWFWHQWAIKHYWNGAGDWHGGYSITCSSSLHTRPTWLGLVA